MENLKKIEPVTAALVFEPKGNEIIERLNLPWKVKIEPEGLINTAVFQYADNGIVLMITFNTVNLVACDENGVQSTYTIPAFIPSENE